MTIDERVSVLMSRLPLRMLDGDEGEIRNRIRSVLLEVARDQRHACEAAANAVVIPAGGECEAVALRVRLEACRAVMNAEIK